MKAIGYISTTMVLTFYSPIMRGWAFAKLWLWFVVPLFRLPVISIPQAIGIVMVVSYLTHQSQATASKEQYWETLLKTACEATLKPLLSLLAGAVVKMWL